MWTFWEARTSKKATKRGRRRQPLGVSGTWNLRDPGTLGTNRRDVESDF